MAAAGDLLKGHLAGFGVDEAVDAPDRALLADRPLSGALETPATQLTI